MRYCKNVERASREPSKLRSQALSIGSRGPSPHQRPSDFIRVSIGHSDGTSHLILQGLARVELKEAVRYKPYRIQRIRPLETPPCDNVKVDALVAKMRELLQERIDLGLPFPFPVMSSSDKQQ